MNTRLALASCCLILFVLIQSPSAAEPDDACLIRLRDVTSTSNITFQHTHGGSGERYIMETVAAGLALFDYDADGFIDIYFLNGAPLKGTVVDTPPKNALYRNNGDWTFTDVTETAGVGDRGFGLGVTVGDYDNDGDPDLYINNYGPNVLYRNNGDGTFADVTREAGVDCGNQVGAGACFLDIDNDGDLDLYAANCVVFSYETHVPITVDGYRWHVGPGAYPAATVNLFRNNGDGTFTDITEASGIGSVAGTGMGIVAGDFDDDGDSDVFVCNDIKGNFLFQNDGKGKFEEIGLVAGVAYDLYGRENASMGVDCGDFDNDGRLDLFMTDDNADYRDDSTKYRVANIVMMNTGNGKFLNVSDQCGDGLAPIESSRGAGFDDLDNDGDIDVVILNSQAPPTILRNESVSSNHWLDIQLRGTQANRDAVGARVTVVADDLTQIAEVHGGRGYQGYHGSRLHFGLGDRDQIDRIEVRWPGSRTETFEGIEIDRMVTLTQGTSGQKSADE